MAEGKWIADLTAATPLEEAARRVLAVRLKVVHDLLPVPDNGKRDAEGVHQLRVSTRRARAAVDIFDAFLPRKRAKKLKKRLRTIRRVAGGLRDWDVFQGELFQHLHTAAAEHFPGLDFLLGYCDAQRQLARSALESSVDTPDDFRKLIKETLEALEAAKDCDTLADLATPWLTQLVDGLCEAADANLDDYHHLHRVRILGKRLRYAMEIFAECFGPAFREQIYPAVETMQDILGRANDSHVAAGRLRALLEDLAAMPAADMRRLGAGLEWLLDQHESRLPYERDQFLNWWREWSPTLRTLSSNK